MSQSPEQVAPSSSVQIVGDKTNGFVLFDPVGGVVYLVDPKADPKSTAPLAQSPLPTLKAPGRAFITGNAKSGVVYCSGTQVFYHTDIGNAKAKWKALLPAPFAIQGICGDLLNGVVIYGGDKLALISNVANNPLWQTTAVSPRIPISGIAGDGTNGIVVYGPLSANHLADFAAADKFVPSVYKFSGPTYTTATPLSNQPIDIDFLTGDGNNGFLAFGENQVQALDAKGNWSKLCSLNFELKAGAGNPKDGLTALIGNDNLVAVWDLKQWFLVQAVPVLAQPVASVDVPTLDMLASTPTTGTASAHSHVTHGGTAGAATGPGGAAIPASADAVKTALVHAADSAHAPHHAATIGH